MAVASSIFVPCPPAQLEVPMNFDAISKNPIPPAWHVGGTGFFLPHGDLTSFSQKFHNFGSAGPNCVFRNGIQIHWHL